MIAEMNDENAEEISRPLFESIHRSYANSNYQEFLRHCLSEKMKEELTEDVLMDGIQKYFYC